MSENKTTVYSYLSASARHNLKQTEAQAFCKALKLALQSRALAEHLHLCGALALSELWTFLTCVHMYTCMLIVMCVVAAADDDDELMLNVLRCHLTY